MSYSNDFHFFFGEKNNNIFSVNCCMPVYLLYSASFQINLEIKKCDNKKLTYPWFHLSLHSKKVDVFGFVVLNFILSHEKLHWTKLKCLNMTVAFVRFINTEFLFLAKASYIPILHLQVSRVNLLFDLI